MTILQLKCFVSLATTMRFMETANMFGLRASTLSKYIDHVEDGFSAKLFQKTQNRWELTRQGEDIFPSVQYIVKHYDDMMEHLYRLKNMDRAAMNVAMAFHQSQILRKLIDFSNAHPDINLTVTEAPSFEIRSLLDTSGIDIAITYEELLWKRYPYTIPIRKDRLTAVVGRGHKLASREEISVAELAGDTFFLFRGDLLMHRFQIHACIAAGFTPAESQHDFRINTILEYVAKNRGVSLLAENAVSSLVNENVVVLPLAENPTLTMSMVFPGEFLPDACQALAEFLRERLAAIPVKAP
jgi:DNA-binding transcriptional LysR family regulator